MPGQGFIDLVWRTENVMCMVVAWILHGIAARSLPNLWQEPWIARLDPIIPIALCIGFMWLPGLQPPEVSLGTKLLLGVVLGFGSGHLVKIIKQSGLGDDERIQDAKR